ncbi:hypothetical protein OG874_16830 [Nocardia sp. NBC_00565]|uniref:hypothetical protein n=1 Tax=Nocardia sp. NBC_00565 TaxID=2975993 RepID=UPI002E818E9E|nr:hypothetical protein [Nocardia sp. NBC_00565]WUC06679.1 hypothetical protein OG874_16830 [Nocardia sp. NBC_00565]
MSRFGIGSKPAPRIAIELSGSGHHPAAAIGTAADSDVWVEVTEPAEAALIRIQAADLRAAQQQTARIKSAAAVAGRDPAGISVLVDIEVIIAADAPGARQRMARLDEMLDIPWVPRSIHYVGTPTGLAGLIADIHAVHVADGVTLLPLELPEVLGHIAFETLPWLESIGVRMAREQVEYVRRRGLRQCATDLHTAGERRSA